MLFGLFGGRMTTDDSLEHIYAANTHNAVQQSVALQLRQRQSSRFDEDAEYLEELRDNLSKANLERGALRAQVTALEKERDNLITTGTYLALSNRAHDNVIKSDANSEALLSLVDDEKQRLLGHDTYMASTRQDIIACAKKAWRIAKK
jgi:predicted polyphosphate/ATP-dependent NAD kinase